MPPRTKFQQPVDKPCNGCPFRRKAMAGWLGAGSPEGFITSVTREELLPCHLTIDYEDPQWKSKWERGLIGQACAGALILGANSAKLPRNPDFPRMKPDSKTVFANPVEFMNYHNDADVRSWDRVDNDD